MVRRTIRRGVLALGVVIAALFATVPLQAAEGNSYTVTRLVSDVPGVAPVLDPDLVNAWGLTASSTSPWWVADNETSVSTLYNGAGMKQALTVAVGTDSGPTGVVFNTLGSGFLVTNGTQSGSSRFIFDGEDGILRGWSPTVDGTHALVAGMGDPGAIFKGLAIADGKLFAADFHNHEVAVICSSGTSATARSTRTPSVPTARTRTRASYVRTATSSRSTACGRSSSATAPTQGRRTRSSSPQGPTMSRTGSSGK